MQAFVGAAQAFGPLQLASPKACSPVSAPRSSFTAGGGPLSNNASRTRSQRVGASPLAMTAYRSGYRGRSGFRNAGYCQPGAADLRNAMAASAPLIREFFGDEFAREMLGRNVPTADRTSGDTAERTLVPEARTGEDDGGFWLRLEIPGFPKELVKVEVKGRTLVARGEMTPPPAEDTDSAATKEDDTTESNPKAKDAPKGLDKGPGGRASIYANFERSFQLPKNAAVDHVTAEVNDGVLFISIDKVKSEQDKVIPITVT